MKYFLLFLSTLIVLAACQKTPTNTVTGQNQLRNSKWRLASGSMVVKLPSGKDTTLNFVNMLSTCNQDDYLGFDSIYTGAVYSGTNKCSPSDPAYIAFTWLLQNTGTTISFNNAINLFYKESMTIQPPKLDTISLNPFVQDTVYPATYALSPFDTASISASIATLTTSTFTINYSIPSTYLDTVGYHAYSPMVRADTINYTITYNSF